MRITIALRLAAFLYSCSGKIKEAETAYKSNLKVFLPIKGHDPVEEGVFTYPYLQHRLVKLPGQGQYATRVQVMYDWL